MAPLREGGAGPAGRRKAASYDTRPRVSMLRSPAHREGLVSVPARRRWSGFAKSWACRRSAPFRETVVYSRALGEVRFREVGRVSPNRSTSRNRGTPRPSGEVQFRAVRVPWPGQCTSRNRGTPRPSGEVQFREVMYLHLGAWRSPVSRSGASPPEPVDFAKPGHPAALRGSPVSRSEGPAAGSVHFAKPGHPAAPQRSPVSRSHVPAPRRLEESSFAKSGACARVSALRETGIHPGPPGKSSFAQ